VAAELIIVTAAGAGWLLWGGYRLRIGLQRRKQFVSALHKARDAQVDVTYRPATAADSELLAAIATDQTTIEACGFAVLGDIVGEVRGRPVAIVRAFCHGSQTTCALASLSLTPQGRWRMSLCSYSDDQMFSTDRGQRPHLAPSPGVYRQTLAPLLPFAQVVDRHRTFATGSSLVRIASQAALIMELQRWHAKSVRWREAQAPAELLEADLKNVLGDAVFARFGKSWVRRLRGRLPEATLRRG
jgi:hypothetical protein